MKPSDELFNLIKSLSKSEKRFFKLQSSIQKGDKNYVRLFDTIDKLESYDETAVKETFQGERFINHFPSEKNHLFKTILKSLRLFYAENTTSSTLILDLKNIEILFQKALYKESSKVIKRAKKLAMQEEKWYYMIELIKYEKRIRELSPSPVKEKEYQLLIEEEREVHNKINNLSGYHLLMTQLNGIIRNGELMRKVDERSEILQISSSLLLREPTQAKSERALFYFHYISGYTYDLLNQPEKVIHHFQRALQLVNSKQSLKEEMFSEYLKCKERLIAANLNLNQIDDAKKVLSRLTQIWEQNISISEDERLKLKRTIMLSKLQYSYRNNHLDGLQEQLEELEELIREDGEKWGKENLVLAKFSLSTGYLKIREFSPALKWANELMNDNENTVRQDLYHLIRGIYLIIHAELGNYKLLDYLIKSINRYWTKREAHLTLESLILTYVKAVKKLPDEEKLAQILVKIKEEVMHEMTKPENTKLAQYVDYSDFFNWKLDLLKGYKQEKQVIS